MIRDTVSHLRAEGQQVFLDAEHFFDGYRANRDYALEVLRTAYDAGAEVVALCDTNGGMLPGWVADVVHDVIETTGVRVGIHCHNDTGCAVANTLAAVERAPPTCRARSTGTASAPATPTSSRWSPTSSSSWTARCCPTAAPRRHPDRARGRRGDELPPASRQPYVGTSAFAHKAGLHATRSRSINLYQHMDPVGVGNDMRLLVSDGGRASIQLKSRELGFDLTDSRRTRTSSPGSPTGSRPWSRAGTPSRPPTRPSSCCWSRRSRRPAGVLRHRVLAVITEKLPSAEAGAEAYSEATVKLKAGGVRYVVTGEGNGPVNALDHALREAIGQACRRSRSST